MRNALSDAWHSFDNPTAIRTKNYLSQSAQDFVANSADVPWYARAGLVRMTAENNQMAAVIPTNNIEAALDVISVIPAVGALRGASTAEKVAAPGIFGVLDEMPEVVATTKLGEETLSATVQPARILAGNPNKVAIIGRNMDGVNRYADELMARAESTWRDSAQHVLEHIRDDSQLRPKELR